MSTIEADRCFRWGRTLLAQGRYREAASLIEKAIIVLRDGGAIAPRVRYLSYLGLSRALAHGPSREDVQICERAAAQHDFDAEVWRNLARVYLLTGKTTRALEAMERGLRRDPGDADLHRMLIRADRRRKPVLPRLGRNHPINRSIGLLRSSWPPRRTAS